MRCFSSILAFLLVATSAFAADGVPPCSGSLDVITFQTSGYEMVGDVVAETEDSITVIPQKGGRVTLQRELIENIQYNAREPERVSTEKFADGFATCVLGLMSSEQAFRVIKVGDNSVFINLGSEAGLEKGVEMGVYREGDEVVDPQTNQVLGRDKDLVGIIHIIGTQDDFSEAVPVDAPVTAFQEGDTGVFLRKAPTVAVADITTEDGTESPYGQFLTGQIINKLNQGRGLKIIEQKDLGSRLLDRFRGVEADAILVGTVTEVEGKGASVNVRMVDTSSAAVLHSSRKLVSNPEKPIEPVTAEQREKEKKEQAGTGKTSEKEQSKKEPDILDRILNAIYNR
jgi:hypothetical protein